MSWSKNESEKSETPPWVPNTPKPEPGFFCHHCNGLGFVPICEVNGHGTAIVRDVTCDCQMGRWEAEYLERDSKDKGGTTIPGRRYRLEDARRKDLVDPKARTHKDHWLHAKLCEARHDMVRKDDNDDWAVRYFEAVVAGADPIAWAEANPRGLVRQVMDFKTATDRKVLTNVS